MLNLIYTINTSRSKESLHSGLASKSGKYHVGYDLLETLSFNLTLFTLFKYAQTKHSKFPRSKYQQQFV